MILPEACCTKCQRIIHAIETYLMRGPFLSHRLANGLVRNLKDLGVHWRCDYTLNPSGPQKRSGIRQTQIPFDLVVFSTLPRRSRIARLWADYAKIKKK